MGVVLNEISTATVRKADAFAYWQDVIVDTFVDLDCESSVSKSFSGHIEDAHFGKLQISRMKSSDIHRTRPRIFRAAANLACWCSKRTAAPKPSNTARISP